MKILDNISVSVKNFQRFETLLIALKCSRRYRVHLHTPMPGSPMFCSNSSRWMVYFRVCFCPGKTYDREMVLKSGLLEKRLWESGYKCLAGRSFTVCDLFDDLSQVKVADIFTGTRPTLCRRNDNKSANCCGKVHVEQQMQRLKCFQMFSQPLPLKMAGSLN